jgi:hypothetical protein
MPVYCLFFLLVKSKPHDWTACVFILELIFATDNDDDTEMDNDDDTQMDNDDDSQWILMLTTK